MMQTLQRLLARIAAVTAIALGAVLGLMLAGFTLVAGLVVGLVALIAAWFGARSLRGPGAAGGTERRDVTVIDVEMREIDDAPAGSGTPHDRRHAPGSGGRGDPDDRRVD